MRINKYYKVLIESSLITVISLYSGKFGWDNQFYIVGLCYFIIAIIYSKKNDLKLGLFSLIILLPFVCIYGGVVFYNRLTHVYPIFIIPLISYLVGILINQLNASHLKKTILIIITANIIILGGIYGIPNWLSYIYNINSAPKVSNIEEVYFVNKDNETVTLSQLPHDIIVLDFWTTTCGICFKKFPNFQKLYDKYSLNDRVGIYAVNLIGKNENLNSITKNKYISKYTFPNLYTTVDFAENIKNTFHFKVVPTIVILKNNELIYRGQLNTEKYILLNNTILLIDEALQE